MRFKFCMASSSCPRMRIPIPDADLALYTSTEHDLQASQSAASVATLHVFWLFPLCYTSPESALVFCLVTFFQLVCLASVSLRLLSPPFICFLSSPIREIAAIAIGRSRFRVICCPCYPHQTTSHAFSILSSLSASRLPGQCRLSA